jgi:hypothetical protein
MWPRRRQSAKKTVKLVEFEGLISKPRLGIVENMPHAVDAAFFGPYLNPKGLRPGPPSLTTATK